MTGRLPQSRTTSASFIRCRQHTRRSQRVRLFSSALGARLAAVRGAILFVNGSRLVVMERFRWDRKPLVLDTYGYEAWRAGEKLWWYDPQPHPKVDELQVTFPHHKHVPPEIKRNRIPAPGITFTAPNLPQLIREIQGTINANGKV